MKKKNTTIELLSEMDKYGINELYNVSPFMEEHFPMPEPTTENSIPWDDKQESTAKHLLNEMQAHGFIKFGMLEETIYNNVLLKPSKKWFNDTDFYISFTIDGFNFLHQYRLKESSVIANQTSIRNMETANKNAEIQKNHSRITIIVAAISVLITLLNFIYLATTDKKYEQLNKQLIELQKQIKASKP